MGGADLQGDQVKIYFFWEPSFGLSRLAFPILSDLQERWGKDRLLIVGLGIEDLEDDDDKRMNPSLERKKSQRTVNRRNRIMWEENKVKHMHWKTPSDLELWLNKHDVDTSDWTGKAGNSTLDGSKKQTQTVRWLWEEVRDEKSTLEYDCNTKQVIRTMQIVRVRVTSADRTDNNNRVLMEEVQQKYPSQTGQKMKLLSKSLKRSSNTPWRRDSISSVLMKAKERGDTKTQQRVKEELN